MRKIQRLVSCSLQTATCGGQATEQLMKDILFAYSVFAFSVDRVFQGMVAEKTLSI